MTSKGGVRADQYPMTLFVYKTGNVLHLWQAKPELTKKSQIRNSIRILFATIVPWEMQNCGSFRSLKGFIFEKRSRSRRNWDHRIVEPSLENMLLWEQALDPPPHHVLNILGLLQTLAPKIGSSTKWSKTWRVNIKRRIKLQYASSPKSTNKSHGTSI